MKSLLAVAIVIAGVAFNQDTGKQTVCRKFDSCSFEGKPTVSVYVEGLNEELKQAGIARADITTEAELLLRKFGVPVVKQDAGDLTVYIRVTGRELTRKSDKRGTGEHYYVVECNIEQDVRLERNPSVVVISAVTWSAILRTGFAPSRKAARDAINEAVQTSTKQFINAYLEANPK